MVIFQGYTLRCAQGVTLKNPVIPAPAKGWSASGGKAGIYHFVIANKAKQSPH